MLIVRGGAGPQTGTTGPRTPTSVPYRLGFGHFMAGCPGGFTRTQRRVADTLKNIQMSVISHCPLRFLPILLPPCLPGKLYIIPVILCHMFLELSPFRAHRLFSEERDLSPEVGCALFGASSVIWSAFWAVAHRVFVVWFPGSALTHLGLCLSALVSSASSTVLATW